MNDTPTPPENDQASSPESDPVTEPQGGQPFFKAPIPEGIETDSDSKLYGMLCHMLALTGLMANGIGFILGPLIIWLLKREQSAFVDDQGKEAVNFQITVFIAMLALFLIGLATCGVGFIVTVPIMIVLGIVDIVLVILAGLEANKGVRYRYPFCWRLFK